MTLALSYEQFRIQPFVDPPDPTDLDSLNQTFRSLDLSNHIIGSKLSEHWIQIVRYLDSNFQNNGAKLSDN
jgi:hypothetical protein